MTERRQPTASVAVAVQQPYHIKYRPRQLEDVIGQHEVVKSLQTALNAPTRQHTYFFFGPSGTGKTTLARIVAAEFDCLIENVIEVDAASNSGIDDMRRVTEGLRYSGFGATPNKAYIIDECHGLSKQAWDSLLKSTEEPPDHVFFFFCSTNPTKIPAAMLTRGPQYALKPVRSTELAGLLCTVADSEKLDAVTDAIIDVVIQAAQGSPRQALVMLAMVQNCHDAEEAESVLQGVGQTKEVIDLCRAMVSGELRWADVQANLKPLVDLSNEGVRIQVTLYLAAVLLNTKETSAPRLLDMLAAFAKPCNPTDKLAPLLLAFGDFCKFPKR